MCISAFKQLRTLLALITAWVVFSAHDVLAQSIILKSTDSDLIISMEAPLGLALSGDALSEPQEFKMGQTQEIRTLGAWTLHQGGRWCVLETPVPGEEDRKVFAAVDNDQKLSLLGVRHAFAEEALADSAKLDASIAVDGRAVAEGRTNGLIVFDDEGSLSGAIPGVLISPEFNVPRQVEVASLEEAYEVAGLRIMDRLRARADPIAFWRAFRGGNRLTAAFTSADGATTTVEISLSGSSRAFGALLTCTEGLRRP